MEAAMTEPVSATYHVFINHRGCDVKKTLASLIYHRLEEAHGLRVFLDEEELRTGDEFPPAIVAAIQSSSVHVAIFSPRYAESRWCLDELCWILDKPNRKIIPVFYDVEPTDLRHIHSGPFEDAFKQHQSKGRDIEKWKTALNKASEISGIKCDISGIKFTWSECDQGKVLGKIVNDVLQGVKREPWVVAEHLVGLDPAVKEIYDEIEKQRGLNGTAIVGIAGMAGLGKSTLAAHLYNLNRSDFKRSCFLSDIRNKDLPSLQRNLIRDLLGCDFHIEDTRQGKGIFRDRLRGLRVLIVLDDADHIEQINSLLVADVVGSRSLILITSTDQDLLRRSSLKTVVYNVKPLRIEHARELFCWHAFDQSKPCEGFENMVEEALKSCDGVPLSLEVVGQHFRGFGKEYWKPELEKLSRRLPDDIMDTLKVSYEALKSEEKEIFLDLGCFFVGEEKELAVRVFEGLGYKGVSDCLQNLRQKSLVKYHDDAQSDEEISISGFFPSFPRKDVITMHDHISQLARGIAREEFRVLPMPKPLRLSCSADIEEMLQFQRGADSCLIRGIRTQKDENLPDCRNYTKSLGVRLFVVEVPIDLSSFFGAWDMSGDLVWLRLRKFSSICLPDTISLRNLRVLELNGHGDLEQLFQRFDVPPRDLSVLNIDVTTTGTQPSQQSSRTLGTQNPTKSGEGTSTSSRSFHLNDFEKGSNSAKQGSRASCFEKFLNWIGRSIKNPSKIILKNNTLLESLPIDFRELNCLRHLDLSGCTNLTHLPNSFSELMHLQYLVLRDCTNLSIPIDILGNISSLEYVDFKGCSKLEYLPTGIANQRSLICLDLRGTALELPLNLALIPDKVQRLGIGIKSSPPKKSCAPRRESLQLTESPQPQLRMPRRLKVLQGTKPQQSLGELRRLKELQGTKPQQSLGELRRLKELKELILIEFDGLKGILWEEIVGPNMKALIIRDCPIYIFSFKEQPTMHGVMGNLRDFTLSGTQISEICIPEGVLPSLETLDLSKNEYLREVRDLPSTLVRLNLEGCLRLGALENLSNLVDLKFLRVNRCYDLQTLNLLNLVDLKFLSVNECYLLETLNVEGLTSLEEIQAEGCWELKRIQGLSQRELLKCLRISANTDVIENDIYNFLTSTSHEKLATAFFSGIVGKSSTYSCGDRAFYERVNREMHSIEGKFNLKVVDVVFSEPPFEFNKKMKELQSYGAILVCFLTYTFFRGNDGIGGEKNVRVRFGASTGGGLFEEYKILRREAPEGSVELHVFMWTEECNLFKDYREYSNIAVSWDWNPHEVIKGWIMIADHKTNVSQVWKEIINALS